MTHFKVSDEAVRLAMDTYYASFRHGKSTEIYYGEETREDAMRAAIESALPVMFEEVLYAYPALIDESIEATKQHQALRFINAWNEPCARMVPLFRIKESK